MKCRTLDTWHGPPTRHRKASPFTAGWTATRTLLEKELRSLNATAAVLELTANQSMMRNDGWPYADARVEPPVRLSFNSKHGTLVYQCDRFNRWQDNVRAIALGLEALRKVNRYGVSDEGQQYAGWQQIEQTTSGVSAVHELADLAGVDRAEGEAMSMKELARKAKLRNHPDVGGDEESFLRVLELTGAEQS